jgi:hypothetical protein
MRLPVVVTCLALASVGLPYAEAGGAPPRGKALEALVEEYLEAPFAKRQQILERVDREVGPLGAQEAKSLARAVLEAAIERGPRLGKGGTQMFFPDGRGKYIQQGKPGKVLFVGLHGGGAGAGEAESAAGSMGGGGWWWLFPEVLEKTEHGWTDSGTEEFVMELIDAAKRGGKVDPNRIYVTGHSMGGYGTWTLGAHHADVFAGAAAYAGAPTCLRRSPTDPAIVAVQPGILPSFFRLPLHVYQSGDDRNVPPESNDFALAALGEWKAKWPTGFKFRYDRVEGRGHAAPAEGYLPSLKWLAEHARDPRPARFLWQPVLSWKRQMYWAYWARPELDALLECAMAPDNVVEITVHEGSVDLTGFSVLLGPPHVDVERDVVVRVNGKERFRGRAQRRLSTLLLTAVRCDPDLLFDARLDL